MGRHHGCFLFPIWQQLCPCLNVPCPVSVHTYAQVFLLSRVLSLLFTTFSEWINTHRALRSLSGTALDPGDKNISRNNSISS